MAKSLIEQMAERITVLENVVTAAFKHSVANAGDEYEFYTCYTYEHHKVPDWVVKARKAMPNLPQRNPLTDKRMRQQDKEKKEWEEKYKK